MRSFISRGVVACALLALAGLIGPPILEAQGSSSASTGRECETLVELSVPNGAVTTASRVAAGSFVAPASDAPPPPASLSFKRLPEFCRVAATLRPSADSDIKIEVWMPSSGWNGKFQAVGNGGWAGTINYRDMAAALARGYATASTDTGHSTPGGAFVLGHPEKYVDYAYRAVREMTLKAKAIIAAYYGSGPRLSYWNGCSTGGRQGLIEAQRYPDDYDGIIAGAQANPRTRLTALHLARVQATLIDPATFIPPSKYPVIHQAVLTACDALDGVKDGLINDPTRCHFDPKVLACTAGPDCLTGTQVETVRKLMSPLKDSRTGAEIFPGWEPGAELGWGAVIAGPEPTALTLDHYRYVVFADPKWDWRTFVLERDLTRAEAVDKGTIDAVDPNLGSFTKHGGKLLMYHGWSDQLAPPRASVNYYTSVVSAMGGSAKTSDWVRLFMAPGMGHCGGGEGPNTFDMISALEDWVERGRAPDQIVASTVKDGKVVRSRPLCPYPQVAIYTGRGSTDEAVSFVCRAQ
jgi:feruloyl esterase